MKQDVLCIAVAAFLHDIGKFIQRIAHDMGESLPEDFPKENYQPQYKDGYSHAHASYTAFFIKNQLKNIPEISNLEELVNLSAKHHMEDSKSNNLELYIKAADRISAGMDRETFKESGVQEISITDYRKTRLMSIFDEVKRETKDYFDRRFQYDLAPFDANSIFPVPKTEQTSDYSTIREGFFAELNAITEKTLQKWFLAFDEINKKWTTFIPSASVKDVIPDISLYDHAKTTSALAQSLFIYHTNQANNITKKGIMDNKSEKKFLYFKAKFNGIQNFIFSVGAETNKKAAKILRGRSFYISLIMKRTAELLCEEIGVAHTAIIMNAAGAITAIFPNTPETIQKIDKVYQIINTWLIQKFYGETSISFSYTPASGHDFTEGLKELIDQTGKDLEKAKFRKIPLNKLGVVSQYFEKDEKPCVYCGKRPATEGDTICPVCNDLIAIGQNILSKKPYQLKSKIFDIYDTVNEYDYDTLYVPKNADNTIKNFDELIRENKEIGIEALGVLKADIDNLGELFDEVSKVRRNTSSIEDNEVLEILKGGSISRLVTFSRMIDSFWTIWLPEELAKNPLFHNIYTVFSGGDDLFLIGKWDKIIDFAFFLKEKFDKYTCMNPAVTLSMGVAILKPGEPISKFYELSEYALSCSKDYSKGQEKVEKNALTLFGETISWEQKEELMACYQDIEQLIAENRINSSALSKLMGFIDMAKKADNITKKLEKERKVSEMELANLKWKSLLTYFISRNNSFKKDETKEERILHFVRKIEDKNQRSILKTMLWKNIYENRTRRN